MAERPRTTVVGGGSWGTALAALLARQGTPTTLWALEPEVVRGINADRRNPLFLPGTSLPESLAATDGLDAALEGAEVVVSVVPTQFIRSVFRGHEPALGDARLLVSASKGIELDTCLLPSEIFAQAVPGALADGMVCLSGPSFAHEVARGVPTAISAASPVAENARQVRDLFSSDDFRVYSSDDRIGVELGGALKNIIAIAAGISDGLDFGHNTLAALITRGLAEITRLGVAKGGHPLTFAGLSGLGDLALTCTGDLSRNRQVGLAIGRGRTLAEHEAETRMVAEGVKTCASARQLAATLGVEMPITEQVYLALHECKDPRQAVMDLMRRELRDEREH